MTPDRMRVVIAEMLGWEEQPEYGWKNKHTGSWQFRQYLPNYLNDLNAMHEAEKVLDVIQRRLFAELLHPNKAQHFLDNDWEVAHATALQKCEAFLRATGRWEEQPLVIDGDHDRDHPTKP